MQTIWKWKVWLIPLLILMVGLLFWPAQAGPSTKLNATDNMSENIGFVSYTDDADWTSDSSAHLLMGGVYGSNTVTSGDTGPLMIDTSGKLLVVDASSTTIATAIKAEDAAHVSTDAGIMALAVRDDTPPTSTGAAGDYVPLLTNATGELYTVDTAGNAILTTMDVDTGSIDTKLGTVGGAADVDGAVTVQLRYIGEAVDNLPAAVGSAAMAASMPVTIATDDTVQLPISNVAKGVAVAGSGQLLTCTLAATDYSATVVSSAVYRVTAVNGIIYLGVADVQAADSAVLWTIPAGDTQIITIPSGTALHYRSDAATVTGRLARIQ